ncbi:hypothetical protein NEF87_004895 [Candidatus Lokiarchaeum ossiferum]|uniref:Uncharacterized protein n=1 Tax=Candidatus Lokiarchaeum ossiferum TaxID=2951803 RepID=A0ABY6HYJ4_9ARCH|nr:hypothetical protein NEF87_004895 [Candidatus Lokiarchaeum sp. B-35]
MIKDSCSQGTKGKDHLRIPESIFTFLETGTLLDGFLKTLAHFPLDATLLQNFLITQEKRFDLSERFQPCVGPRLEVKRCHDLLVELLDFADWQERIEFLFQLWGANINPDWTVVHHWDMLRSLYHAIYFPSEVYALLQDDLAGRYLSPFDREGDCS